MANDTHPTETAAQPAATPPQNGPKKHGPKRRKAARKTAAAKRAAAAAPVVVEIAPLAQPAQMRKRHWGVLFSFILLVLVPVAVAGWYLARVSVNQYASVAGFTVRQDQGASATDLLGGFSQIIGSGGGGSDTSILHKFIQSPALLKTLERDLGLIAHYAQPHETDPLFSMDPEADAEDLARYWARTSSIFHDQSSGLIELQILAFDPQYAQMVAQAVLRESQSLINALNAQARQDIIQYAKADLELAQERLKIAQNALTQFRNRTQIVDPETDLKGRLSVLNNLQQQLANALIESDLLLDGSGSNDPRMQQAQHRIEVIRNRIKQERRNFASQEGTVDGVDYPVLIAEYENLLLDRQFSEKSYSAALAALESARADATRENRYLAVFIQPTLPESAEYPRRWMLFGMAALFALLAWSILVLIYYSVRDSR